MSYNDEISGIINITSNQVSSTNNSQFILNVSPALKLTKGIEIALDSCSINNTVSNINAQYNNISFSYINCASVTRTVNLLQGATGGMLQYTDINGILQTAMTAYGDYLVNTSTGQNVYFLSVTANPLYSNVLLTANLVPTAAEISGQTGIGVGLSNPASMSLPGSDSTMQFVIPSGGLTTVFGFPAGNYPSSPSSSNYFATSPNLPNITPVTSLSLTCSIAAPSRFNNISNYLATIPITVGYNSTQTYVAQNRLWNKTLEGTFDSLTLNICDQNGNPLNNTLLSSFGNTFIIVMRVSK